MSVSRFWREFDARYKLEGNQCTVCGKKFYPPREICDDCHRKSVGKMEKFQFSGLGKLHTYTVIHTPPSEFKDQSPYIVGIVELEEGPKVTTQIVECDPENVKIGMPVKSVFRKIKAEGEGGVIQYGYKFVPQDTIMG